MSLKPWEAGYVAPQAPSQEEVRAARAENSAKGGKNKGENKARARRGEPAQYGEKTTRDMINRGLNPNPILDPTKGDRGKPDPNSATTARLQLKTDENLSLEDRTKAHIFVEHYLKSFDAPQALIMAGGNPATAGSVAWEMLRWPYVQQLLEETVEAMEEEGLLSRKRVLMGLLKEAHYHGHDSSHGARIRAWMGLARIKKMDVQVTENHHTVKGGVMLIPVTPEAETIDGWAQVVSADQAALKDEVRK